MHGRHAVGWAGALAISLLLGAAAVALWAQAAASGQPTARAIAPASPRAAAAPLEALAALHQDAPADPLRLDIPAIGVDAPVQPVGVLPGGALGVPENWSSVGWWDGGPSPGQAGDAVIDGHLDSWTAPAVFWSLDRLVVGDGITVTLSDGTVARFTVNSIHAYPYQAAPLASIFTASGPPRITLITCGGAWSASRQIYAERVVVTAVPTSAP